MTYFFFAKIIWCLVINPIEIQAHIIVFIMAGMQTCVAVVTDISSVLENLHRSDGKSKCYIYMEVFSAML